MNTSDLIKLLRSIEDIFYWVKEAADTIELLQALLNQAELDSEARRESIVHLLAENERLQAELERIDRIAAIGSVDSWMSLSDDDKRKWFVRTQDIDAAKSKIIGDAEAELNQARERDKSNIWLWTHCRALGMDKKSNSGSLRDDVALFVVDLHTELATAREREAKAVKDMQGRCFDAVEDEASRDAIRSLTTQETK